VKATKGLAKLLGEEGHGRKEKRMLPRLPDWISIPLLKLMMKVLPVRKIVDMLGTMSEREMYSCMQPQIEKWSDEELDRGIKDIREGNYYGLDGYIALIEKTGLTREVMLQWLESERFLRNHRKKYHGSEAER